MNVQYYFDRQVNSNTIQQNLPEYYTSLKAENFPYPCVYSHAFTSIPHYIYYGSFYYSYDINANEGYLGILWVRPLLVISTMSWQRRIMDS